MNQKKARDDGLKWYNMSEYVDIDTGEMIPLYIIKRKEYVIKNVEKKYEIDKEKKTAICKRMHMCKKNPQTKLEL